MHRPPTLEQVPEGEWYCGACAKESKEASTEGASAVAAASNVDASSLERAGASIFLPFAIQSDARDAPGDLPGSSAITRVAKAPRRAAPQRSAQPEQHLAVQVKSTPSPQSQREWGINAVHMVVEQRRQRKEQEKRMERELQRHDRVRRAHERTLREDEDVQSEREHEHDGARYGAQLHVDGFTPAAPQADRGDPGAAEAEGGCAREEHAATCSEPAQDGVEDQVGTAVREGCGVRDDGVEDKADPREWMDGLLHRQRDLAALADVGREGGMKGVRQGVESRANYLKNPASGCEEEEQGNGDKKDKEDGDECSGVAAAASLQISSLIMFEGGALDDGGPDLSGKECEEPHDDPSCSWV
jgi:hypothetical protein